MTVHLITIGDEILIGQIIDTNSAWMAQQLNLIGASIQQITSISDSKKAIQDAMKMAGQSADIVLMTGGLGPTKDDITKLTLCEYFNDRLIENEVALAHHAWLVYKDRIGQWWQSVIPYKLS